MKPSHVRGVEVDSFIHQQQMATSLHENSVLGYRGLIGKIKVQNTRNFYCKQIIRN